MAIADNESDLMTVDEFAKKWRVDSSVVRWWIKREFIGYMLVGDRLMVRRSTVIKPITPNLLREELIALFVSSGTAANMEEATTVVDSIDQSLWREMADSMKSEVNRG